MNDPTTFETISVELPEAFDPRWNRIPGITVDGHRVTLDPGAYFFKFTDHTWLVIPWEQVARDMLGAVETPDKSLEQIALEYIRANATPTGDAATVLATGYEVYRYVFREEHLADLGMPQITPGHLTMLRQAGTFMALNKVELTGEISNIGPAWFFNSTTRAVFDLTDEQGDMLDELYHGGWFNETRRLELVRAHTALGGRLVHGCQSVPDQTGGAVVPYGAPLGAFRAELARMKDGWIAAVEACRVTA
ncbi:MULTISPECIES: hypothetical protein [Thermomonospora]|uniref:Uncharacterized protein n=1 Tax=Thermomonospora cellulosilytica TaxID=1411118 RepID=A0A7W3N5N7_9ACTN|nr:MULTISPECIES: hypothetical protein [Thermomonospora]MBA9008000.1 hypothetical protein [Thermomonospora cellulosilytica]